MHARVVCAGGRHGERYSRDCSRCPDTDGDRPCFHSCYPGLGEPVQHRAQQRSVWGQETERNRYGVCLLSSRALRVDAIEKAASSENKVWTNTFRSRPCTGTLGRKAPGHSDPLPGLRKMIECKRLYFLLTNPIPRNVLIFTQRRLPRPGLRRWGGTAINTAIV